MSPACKEKRMAILDNVNASIRAQRYRVSEHARDEMKADRLREPELLAATMAGEVVEDYPKAYPCPACLVLSRLAGGEAVHTVWAFDARSSYAVLVTAYRPDPARWSADLRKRGRP
jgi:hypothetical protein